VGRPAYSLETAYRYYNRKYFNNELPNPPEVIVRWGNIKILGYQEGDEIVINRRHRRQSIWRMTLLHEMCHLATPSARTHHGKEFQAKMLALAQQGAFNKLW
jgi:hypothetical protein